MGTYGPIDGDLSSRPLVYRGIIDIQSMYPYIAKRASRWEKVVGKKEKKGKGKEREEMPKRGESSSSGGTLGYFDGEPDIIP